MSRVAFVAAMAAVLVLGTPGCGAGADSHNNTDGGVGTCFTWFSVSPAQAQAPATITLSGQIDREGAVSGIERYDWNVFGSEGQPMSFATTDPDGRSIAFEAGAPGVYRAVLGGSVGTVTCSSFDLFINVGDPNARTARYRLRAVPLADQPAPVQEFPITVYGGADAYLDSIVLSQGAIMEGMIESESGQPVAAYLRARPTARATPLREGFAGADGRFSLRVLEDVYDVLVIPEDNAWAPVRIADMLAENPAQAAQVLVTPGQAVEGVILDGDGAPVAGARVSMRIEGVPSTIATTGPDGSFAIRTRTLGSAALTVVPAGLSALPALEVTADAGLVVDGSSVEIRYAPHSARSISVPLRHSDGTTPAASARVTWIARPMADAAQVRAGAQSVNAHATMRRSLVADATGTTAAIALVDAVYDVIVEPGADAGAGQAVALRQVDLSDGQPAPAFLALAPPARITGIIENAAGTPAGGVEILATPTGILGQTMAAGQRAITGPDGSFDLAVAGSGQYDITWKGRDVGRWWQEVQAPAPGQTLALGTIARPPIITLSGQVRIPWVANAEGVHLMLLCRQCSGVAADRPVAETITRGNGGFELHVPDPGVTTGNARTTGGDAR
jgi:hypothetical protein